MSRALRPFVGQRVRVSFEDAFFTDGTLLDARDTVCLVEFPPIPDGLIRAPDDPAEVSDEENHALLRRLHAAVGKVWCMSARVTRYEA